MRRATRQAQKRRRRRHCRPRTRFSDVVPRPVSARELHASQSSHSTLEAVMLSWAIGFFIVAIIAAIFGFTGLAGAAAGIAKVLFFLFLIAFIVSLVMGYRGRGGGPGTPPAV